MNAQIWVSILDFVEARTPCELKQTSVIRQSNNFKCGAKRFAILLVVIPSNTVSKLWESYNFISRSGWNLICTTNIRK